ncbi:MAG: pyridoxal phosphate-dependent aminotransferase [Candidatus Aenigmarchaeota archaeon]|nr:pyridoxal phosphate-dependent aminotransferase [Candidatus Aenigmarchaeota archaeon]
MMLPASRMGQVRKSLLRTYAEKAPNGAINLGLGQLEFPLPESVRQAGIRALQDGHTRYSPNAGFAELRQLVAENCNAERGTDFTAGNVIINCGAEEALFAALFALVDQGDKAVILEPAYPAYAPILQALGAQVNMVRMAEAGIDFTRLESAARDAKAVILNFPNNPTGAILPKKQAAELAALAERHGFAVISDEVYSALYYEERNFSPAIGTDQAIIIDGISKRASAAGLRLGWTIAPLSIARQLEAAHQYLTTCASSVSQAAAMAALADKRHEQAFRHALQQRRDAMWDEFRHWQVGRAAKPGGAFYFFPDLSELGSGTELADQALANGVSVIPGEAFGNAGNGHLRLSFTAAPEEIREGMRRIAEAIL